MVVVGDPEFNAQLLLQVTEDIEKAYGIRPPGNGDDDEIPTFDHFMPIKGFSNSIDCFQNDVHRYTSTAIPPVLSKKLSQF